MVNGVVKTQHITEREAAQSAINFEKANPVDDVSYFHDYEVDVTDLHAGGSTPPTPPASAPAAPTNFVVPQETIGPNSAFGLWEDNSNDEVSFVVKARVTGSGQPFTDRETFGEDTPSGTFAGLDPNVSYDAYVVAVGLGGLESDPSNTVSFTTAAALAVPAAPSGLAGGTATANVLPITWNDNSSNEGGFVFFHSIDGGATYQEGSAFNANLEAGNAAGLPSNQVQKGYLVARNAAGDSAPSNIIDFTTTAPGAGVVITQDATTVTVTVGSDVTVLSKANGTVVSSSSSVGAEFDGGRIGIKSSNGAGAATSRAVINTVTTIDEAKNVVDFQITFEDDLFATICYRFYAGSPDFAVEIMVDDKPAPYTYEDYFNFPTDRYIGDFEFVIESSKALTPSVVAVESPWQQGASAALGPKIRTECIPYPTFPGLVHLGFNDSEPNNPTLRVRKQSATSERVTQIVVDNLPTGVEYSLAILAEQSIEDPNLPGNVDIEVVSTSGTNTERVSQSFGNYAALTNTHTFDANSRINVKGTLTNDLGTSYTYFAGLRLTPVGGGADIIVRPEHATNDALDASPHALVFDDLYEQSPTELYATASEFGVRFAKDPWFQLNGGNGVGFEIWVSHTSSSANLLTRSQTVPTPIAANSIDENATTIPAYTSLLQAAAPRLKPITWAVNAANQYCAGRGGEDLQDGYINGDQDQVTDVAGDHYDQDNAWHEQWRAGGEDEQFDRVRKAILHSRNSEITKYEVKRAKNDGCGLRKGTTPFGRRQNRTSNWVSALQWPMLMHWDNYRANPNNVRVAKMQTDAGIYLGRRDRLTNTFFTREASRTAVAICWAHIGGIRHFQDEGTSYYSTTVEQPLPVGSSPFDMAVEWFTHLVTEYRMTGRASGQVDWFGAGDSGFVSGYPHQWIWKAQFMQPFKAFRDILIADGNYAALVADIEAVMHGTVDKLISTYLRNPGGNWEICYKTNEDFSPDTWNTLGSYSGPLETVTCWWLESMAISHSLRPNATVQSTAVSLYNYVFPALQTMHPNTRQLASIRLGHFYEEFGGVI